MHSDGINTNHDTFIIYLVLSDSEVTGEIGDPLAARRRIIVFIDALTDFSLVSLMLKHSMSRSRIARTFLSRWRIIGHIILVMVHRLNDSQYDQLIHGISISIYCHLN